MNEIDDRAKRWATIIFIITSWLIVVTTIYGAYQTGATDERRRIYQELRDNMRPGAMLDIPSGTGGKMRIKIRPVG